MNGSSVLAVWSNINDSIHHPKLNKILQSKSIMIPHQMNILYCGNWYIISKPELSTNIIKMKHKLPYTPQGRRWSNLSMIGGLLVNCPPNFHHVFCIKLFWESDLSVISTFNNATYPFWGVSVASTPGGFFKINWASLCFVSSDPV